ncbi:MAG: hypothetical protein HN950_02025 [Chloroflexi bacterium]|jgi:hypothetical protein|nr:hypothetical protein [Chloroflexota bacterium]MBT6988059.1 hypothetical protein [Chloroflexota bacterium]
METIKQISPTELEPLASGLAETFIQRWDLYPKQLEDGSYISVKKTLSENHILAHLRGDITLGLYLLDKESQARFIVIDADDEDQMDGLFAISRSLEHHRVPSYLERSRRGGHLWFFFDEPVPAKDARLFGKGLLAAHNISPEIELYPKQDKLQNGPGSLIRMPFGVHRKDGNRYSIISNLGQPIAPRLKDQIPYFFNPQTVSEAAFETFWKLGQPTEPKPEFSPTEAAGDTLSQSIKAAMPVLDFVSQYVELTNGGVGHCPFHEDQNSSFSVNAEENYWHCFAGCGGGSIIDFWMKFKGSDFKSAIGELAGMLLM